MEEQRIVMMYLNLVKRWFGGLWERLFPRGLRRSPALPVAIVLMVVGVPIVAWKLHRRGQFAAVKREIQGEQQGSPAMGPRPGGLDPMVLTLTQPGVGSVPEFRSVTLLPGLGMEVLQITAYVPGRGEVELLAAPTLQEVADGTAAPRVGLNDRWGAIELPWAGPQTGVVTPIGSAVRTSWHGQMIEAPTDSPARAVAEGGLLARLGADATDLKAAPGGGQTASASFHAGNFDGRWPGRTDVNVAVTLNAKTMDLVVTAKNVGEQAEPMGIGWHPRFAVPSGNRGAVEVQLPGGERMDVADHVKGTPTGSFGAPGPSLSRFQGRPVALGGEALEETLTHLTAGFGAAGPAVEMRDTAWQFGLRMLALSAKVREVQVYSPGAAKFVSAGMQTNLDDPLGREWAVGDEAIATLGPGETMEWKVRLEIFAAAGHGAEQR